MGYIEELPTSHYGRMTVTLLHTIGRFMFGFVSGALVVGVLWIVRDDFTRGMDYMIQISKDNPDFCTQVKSTAYPRVKGAKK